MQQIIRFMRKNLKYILPVILLVTVFFSFKISNEKEEEKDKILVLILRNLLSQNHYEPKQINDDFSIVVYNNFIESLDPAKRYFIQSDIDEFSQYKTAVDDDILQGDIQFYKTVYGRFKQRIEESKTYYEEILKEPYDFTVNETINLDYESIPYAKDSNELKEYWRKQLKFSTLSRLHDKISEIAVIDSIEDLSDFEKEFRANLLKEDFAFESEYNTKTEVAKVQEFLLDKGITISEGIDSIYNQSTQDAIEIYLINIKHEPVTFNDDKFALLEVEARERTFKNYQDYYERLEELDDIDYFSTYLNSITAAFDPHTSYFPPRDKKNFDERLSGKLEGIGARLQHKNDYTKVTELITGGPAWKAGELEAGDIILKVAQGTEEPIDIVGMRLEDAIEYIKGPKGTEVRLTLRKIDGSIETISIIRDIVEIEETFVKSSIVEKDGKKYGVINLPSFYIDFSDRDARNCAKDMAKEIEYLKEEGVDGVMIDLRNNGGGSLPAVVEMAGLFIKDGPIVQVKFKGEQPIVQKDRNRSILWNGPMVVLVNELSASASEIFAAAMQDYERAVIMGSKQTYGKGTVQTVMDLNKYVNYPDNLGGMTLTIQKFYRVNGGSTQLEGVKPDVVLPTRYSYMNIGEKDYKNPLPWTEITKANYYKWAKYKNLNDVIKNSQKRIAQNEQFSIIDENAKWLKTGQDDNIAYLNYEAYKNDLDEHTEKSKKFDVISDYSNGLEFTSPKYEVKMIEQDSTLGIKREAWHKNLSKDPYIKEGVLVLSELKVKK